MGFKFQFPAQETGEDTTVKIDEKANKEIKETEKENSFLPKWAQTIKTFFDNTINLIAVGLVFGAMFLSGVYGFVIMAIALFIYFIYKVFQAKKEKDEDNFYFYLFLILLLTIIFYHFKKRGFKI